MATFTKPVQIIQSQYKSIFQELGALNEEPISTVFKARSKSDHKFYAIKKIPFEGKDKEQTLTEIKTLKNLDCDYVVKYIDHWIEENYYIGTTDDRLKLSNLLFKPEKTYLLHIQLELISMPLNCVIKILNNTRQKNSMIAEHYGIACEIFIQILECVNYLHTLPFTMIHRDLKPENIMLVKGENNRFVKLINFSLSTYHAYDDQSHSKSRGTREYRAPEISTGKYDNKADIYSLGLIIQDLFNIDFNTETINVDINIKELYGYIKNLCLKCLNIIAKDRPSCEYMLNNRALWAFYSPEEKASFDMFKKIATEKYDILFSPIFDYKSAISNPVLLDLYGKALLKCVDRKLLFKKNIEKWRKLINLKKLIPELIELLQVVDRKSFLSSLKTLKSINKDDQKKDYIMQNIVNLNDENEFQLFLQILLHTGHDELAFNLYPPCIDMINISRCDPRNGFIPQFSFGLFHQRDIINRKMSEQVFMDKCYPMDKSPRGLCYIVNNYFTVGTYREMQRFRNIFYQLHFDVIMDKNLGAQELRKRLFSLSKSGDLNKHNAFVFLIITHGNERKQFYGFDGEPIDIDDISEMFDNKECPQLQKKPKMFFLNCCRGSKDNYGVDVALTLATPLFHEQTTAVKSLPVKNDFIIVYSTLDGFVSYADWYSGTNFGKTFADMLVENAWTVDLNAILTFTNGEMVETEEKLPIEYKQPIEWVNSLTKLIKLSPFTPKVIELTEI